MPAIKRTVPARPLPWPSGAMELRAKRSIWGCGERGWPPEAPSVLARPVVMFWRCNRLGPSTAAG